MQLRIFRIPLIFLLFGALWAVTSDPVITLLASHHTFYIQDSIRGFNDIIFVIVSTVLLYIQVKKEKKKLRASEEQYKTLFFSNPNPMWIYHIETRKFIEVNQAAINKYGYSRNEFLSMTIMDIRPPRDIGKLEDSIKIGETTMSDGFLWEHITKPGDSIIVSITSHHLTFNGLYCSLVMVTDVTDVIRNKEKLEKAFLQEKLLNDKLEENIRATQKAHAASRRMAEVLDKIKNLVVMINKEGYIIWVNNAFSSFTGYQLTEVIGKRADKILFGPKTDRVAVGSIIGAMTDRKFYQGELINYKKDGGEYWTQVNISPIFDENGEFDFFVSVENIITEQKEKELLLKHQYKAFREIAWTISHETRRPLASILSLVGMIKETGCNNERNELYGLLEKCSNELDEIVKNNIRKINRQEEMINPAQPRPKISEPE